MHIYIKVLILSRTNHKSNNLFFWYDNYLRIHIMRLTEIIAAIPDVRHPQMHTLPLCGATLSAGVRSVLYSSFTLVASHRSCNRQMVASITVCNGVLWTSGLEAWFQLPLYSREIMTRKCRIILLFFLLSLFRNVFFGGKVVAQIGWLESNQF